ncbi:MAG: hypothetical protein ACQEUZ_17805 [Pseudomonadota bacterium]
MQDVKQQARALYDEFGPRAIATAAQRAVRHEEAGERDRAHVWRRIEESLKELRGARQS